MGTAESSERASADTKGEEVLKDADGKMQLPDTVVASMASMGYKPYDQDDGGKKK